MDVSLPFIRFTHQVSNRVQVLNAPAKKIRQLFNYSVGVATDAVLIELVRGGVAVDSYLVPQEA
jgi:hypothetical protein